jgi:hypothetical protein
LGRRRLISFEGRKAFFSEEKKQKTFGSLPVARSVQPGQDVKVFWFAQGGLRLFFKKELLP